MSKDIRLEPVKSIPSYAVIIRAIHMDGQDQEDAFVELRRRGLWLTEAQLRAAGSVK